MGIFIVALTSFSMASSGAVASCPNSAAAAEALAGKLRLVSSTPEIIDDEEFAIIGAAGESIYSADNLKVFGVQPTKVEKKIVNGRLRSIQFSLPGKQNDYAAPFAAAYPNTKHSLDTGFVNDEVPAGNFERAEVKTWQQIVRLLCTYG